ncbi:MAG TPA: OmpH family outer membrane protein [Ignavibacteriaceae bacterium]|jgi:outer membrane protein|nr:OmpH family outer membrane protein [Ignavibacteriaceae bacterium]
MKTKTISIALFLFLSGITFGQLKIGYVDSDALLNQMLDAQDARKQLDQFIQDWQNELNQMDKEWKTKFDDYEKRKLIMSDQSRAEMESDLIKLEQKITEFREKKFGTNGELFQKQDELMKPVQNKLFTAIKEVAEEEQLDFVLDRSGDILILYAKEQHDITNLVLEKIK